MLIPYSANKAVIWCEYLETHARRIYAQSDCLNLNRVVITLSELIKAKKVSNFFKAKDIYRRNREWLDDTELVKAACEVLVEKNWLKKQEPEKGKGRPPGPKYSINPVFL